MDFFCLLREHARTRADVLAISSPRRSMTYRKLWSRIERATARLQCEWGVIKDGTVAYRGNSHPDSLVLYLALARSGARLLPLSPSVLNTQGSFPAQTSGWSLQIVDDDLLKTSVDSDYPIRALSALIASRCPHEPREIREDGHWPALLHWTAHAPVQAYSLAQLAQASAAALPMMQARVDQLLQPQALSGTVLPVLQSGGCLVVP